MLGIQQLGILLIVKDLEQRTGKPVEGKLIRDIACDKLGITHPEQVTITLNRLKARGFLKSTGPGTVRYRPTQDALAEVIESVAACENIAELAKL